MTKLGSPAKPVQPFDIPTLVASIAGSVIGAWPLGSPETIAANLLAALHQDDDAHDTCSLTACLNPLHPGPCKGWKGTLFDTAPGAWHSLEAAKVEKANHARVKKIEALKQAGKPIPHKLLTPIVAKPHPHAGQTANKATGEAHEAGKAVTQNAGVHPSAPGKVTLGQASKTLGPVEKGPKGKKPTLGSKGIAFVIAQDKVTPQYKLDKAAAITPEQWAGLSEADQSTIRGELAKVQKDGFGPQQKKAADLLAKLPSGTNPPDKVTAPVGIGVGAKPVKLPPLAKPEAPEAPKSAATLGETAPHHIPKTPGQPLSAKNYTPAMKTATEQAALAANPPTIHALQGTFAERFKAYGKLNAEEWKALPEGTKTTIVKDMINAVAGDKQLHQGFVDENGKAFTPVSAWMTRRNIEVPKLEQNKIDKWVPVHAKDKPVKAAVKPVIPEKTTVKVLNKFGTDSHVTEVNHPKYGEAKAAEATPSATPKLADLNAGKPNKGSTDQVGIYNKPHVGGHVSSTSTGLPSGYKLSKDSMGYTLTYKAKGSVFGPKTIRTSDDQGSLEKYAQDHAAAAAPIIAKHAAAGTSPNAELSKLTPEKVAEHAATGKAPAAPKAEEPKTPTAVEKAQAEAVTKPGEPPTKLQELEAKAAEAKAKLEAHRAKPKLTETYTPKPKAEPTKLSEVATPKTAVPTGGKAEPVGTMTPLNVTKIINKEGSAHLQLGGKTIEVGYSDSGKEGTLTFVPGLGTGKGHYVVTTKGGEKYQIGKTEQVKVMPKPDAPSAKAAPTKLSDTSKLKAAEDKVAAAKAAVEAHRAKPKLTESFTPKPKPQPKHIQDAIAMAEGKAPGATWSKNHLAAYQKLSADEFHALPKDAQATVVAELTKGKSKFLDPKKIAAAEALLTKFGHGEGPKIAAPKAAEAPKEPIGFAKHLHDHSVTQAEAKKVAEQTPISAHFAVAKQAAGLNGMDNPDSSLISSDALDAADKAVNQLTAPHDGTKVLDDPAVSAAVEHLAKTAFDLKYAQTVNGAKAHAYNKISTTLSKDDGKLSPIEKASLQHYQKHLISHPVKTDMATLDKLQKDAAAAHVDLSDKLQAATAKANAPKAEDMTPAQIKDRAEQLLGKSASEPHATLSLSDLKEAKKAGQAQAAEETGWPSQYPAVVLNDPSVASKYAALESVITQTVAWKNAIAKLDTHIGDEHHAALGKGVDVHGNPLSADDKKVIEKHAEQLKADHANLYETLAAQQSKLAPAAAAFTEAATKAAGSSGPAEPNKLTPFDEHTIAEAYQTAWAKHATSAVTYGLKTYDQQQQVKSHLDYLPFKHDLEDLRHLAGKVALAHAEVNTAESNIPTNDVTGLKDLKSPEFSAWHDKLLAQDALEKQFNAVHKQAQTKLDAIRTSVGLKKRALPKLDAAAVKATAAEGGFYKSTGYNGPNHGFPGSGKNYMLSKVGPKLAVAHKTSAEKKADKLDATSPPGEPVKLGTTSAPGEPVKLGGDSSIADIPAALKKTITTDFKGLPKGVYLADPAEDVFGNLVNLAAAHGKAVPGGLSVDQVLKTIDETHSKNLGVANSGLLHKKITDWLNTADGKLYAESHSTPQTSVVKQLAGEIDLPKGVALAPGEKVQKLAGPGPHDASLDAKAFKPLTSLDAQQAQDAWMKANGVKWTEAQKKSIKTYTGSTYTTYNSYLRGESTGAFATKQAVINIQSAMHPLPQHTLLKRGTGWPPELAAYQSDPHKLMGKTFEDKAFVSTTVAGSSGHFSGQPLQLTIEAPAGTPAAFINGISHFKGTENEMLLAAGTKFKVLSVETKNGKTHMRVRIVGDK
jgi:hypothetical protein